MTGQTDLPPGHLLRGHEDKLDTHEGHLEAYSEVLGGLDPDAVRGVMLIIEAGNTSDTLPTLAPDVDAESAMWHMLASHISHVAESIEAPPEAVAQHAVHVLQDMVPADQ